jgi:hypothetical protein
MNGYLKFNFGLYKLKQRHLNILNQKLGISSHFENENAFGDVIASISLLQPIYMRLERPITHDNDCERMERYVFEEGGDFEGSGDGSSGRGGNSSSSSSNSSGSGGSNTSIAPQKNSPQKKSLAAFCRVLLEPRSLFIMEDECRFHWRHGITRHRKVVLPGVNENDRFEAQLEGRGEVEENSKVIENNNKVNTETNEAKLTRLILNSEKSETNLGPPKCRKLESCVSTLDELLSGRKVLGINLSTVSENPAKNENTENARHVRWLDRSEPEMEIVNGVPVPLGPPELSEMERYRRVSLTIRHLKSGRRKVAQDEDQLGTRWVDDVKGVKEGDDVKRVKAEEINGNG